MYGYVVIFSMWITVGGMKCRKSDGGTEETVRRLFQEILSHECDREELRNVIVIVVLVAILRDFVDAATRQIICMC